MSQWPQTSNYSNIHNSLMHMENSVPHWAQWPRYTMFLYSSTSFLDFICPPPAHPSPLLTFSLHNQCPSWKVLPNFHFMCCISKFCPRLGRLWLLWALLMLPVYKCCLVVSTAALASTVEPRSIFLTTIVFPHVPFAIFVPEWSSI